ncbi:unnamed protein product [Porites evermanni]|uniref:DNA-directed DNA polymerase n=1 Tax=Porites evermanni TaxID=104178 RepID=A0ABN8PF85_9CNID|nr:unnamed protein product [Porites evermanni]
MLGIGASETMEAKCRSQPEIYSDVRPTTWTQGRGRFEYWSNTCIGCCDGNLIKDLKIPEDYWMTLQIGSREHRKEGLAVQEKRGKFQREILHKGLFILNPFYCKVCRREFYGEQCFMAHLIEEEVVGKDLEKMKQKLEQDLEEELPSIVEMKNVCDQYRKCKDCLSLVIKDVRIFNEDVMEVSVMKKEKDACGGAGKTNILISCFTTALAHLKLYAELKKLGEQVLYCDTDTVILPLETRRAVYTYRNLFG